MDVDFLIGKKEERENKNYVIEKSILEKWISIFENEHYKNHFGIVQNSSDYTTLQYNNFDLIRLKYSDKVRWIKIFLTKEDKVVYLNNELFSSQKNKNELYWKSIINDDKDINKYINIIKHRIDEIK